MQPAASPPPATLAEIDWINDFLSATARISADDLGSILCFSLIWNMFEGLVCNKNASANAFEQAVRHLHQRGKLSIADYDDHLKYFTRRYVDDGKVNHRFERLNLRKNDRKQLVRDVLEGRETNEQRVILAMLIIVYRYRCNLFHGEKSLHNLPGQKDNFETANQLLMKFLEMWKARCE